MRNEEKLRSLNARLDNDPLRKENDRLLAHPNEAFDIIERLQAKAHERRQNRRPETQDDLLLCIACLGPHTTYDFIETLTLKGESIHHHLSQLQNIDFLDVDDEFQWALLRDGRRYLTQRGLVP